MKPRHAIGLATAWLLVGCGGAPPPAGPPVVIVNAEPEPTLTGAPEPAATSSIESPQAERSEGAGTESGIPSPPDVAAPPVDAAVTASGLATKVLSNGAGLSHPADADKVKVLYTGWTKDGKMIDSTSLRGTPFTVGVTDVIAGWTEALKLMVEGEKRRVWVPAHLAYGTSPARGAPAGDLTFDIELLEIVAAPKTPADVRAPPANAKRTPSGLAYRILVKGSGTVHPKPTDRVTVNYSGWMTDGTLFDSSISRGAPATFSLQHLIKGWAEAATLLVEGDKARFWIPANLAYGNSPSRPGAPKGMLVFDIELLNIQ